MSKPLAFTPVTFPPGCHRCGMTAAKIVRDRDGIAVLLCCDPLWLPTVVPAQNATCTCGPNAGEYDACYGEAFRCDGCGEADDSKPMPFYEKYGVSDLFYCEPCGQDWKAVGCAVVSVPVMVALSSEAAA